jgi:putative ABC transport system permease protein
VIRLSGRFRSALIIGIQGIRARKMRTLLSVVSLFLGVLAVVVVQAGAEIAQRALLSDIELTQGKDGTLQAYLPSTPEVTELTLDTVRGRTDAVAMTTTQVIIGEPGVTPVNQGGMMFDQIGEGGPRNGAPSGGYVQCDPYVGCREIVDPNRTISPPGQAIELQLTAMTADVRVFRPFRFEVGQWLDFSAKPSLSPRIVLNKEAAKGFARYHVPAEMRIPGAVTNPTPRIIGVVDDGQMQPAAYVRADELLNWIPAAPGPNAQMGYGGGPGLQLMMSPAATDVAQILRARLAGAGITDDMVHLEPINSRERYEQGLALVRWVFLGMAALVLLIGVAGILNVGLATVGERVEEFALRRAVGTPRLLLAGIVLAETLLTGLLTAAAAIGVAALAVRAAGLLLASREPFLQNVAFPWQAAVAGVIAGLVAGLLGGLIPAVRAARIPIATVMRA